MISTLLAGVAAVTMVTGYAGAEAAPAPAAGHQMDAAMSCPMSVTGATVSMAPTAAGASLTFTTTSPEKVAELRHRARDTAEMHERSHGSSGTHGDLMGGGPMGGMTGGDPMMGGTAGRGRMMGSENVAAHVSSAQPMPQSHATVTDVERGARITLTPSDPADLRKLQAAVGARAERMQQHGCGPMVRQ